MRLSHSSIDVLYECEYIALHITNIKGGEKSNEKI
jgi:hypothetical protein